MIKEAEQVRKIHGSVRKYMELQGTLLDEDEGALVQQLAFGVAAVHLLLLVEDAGHVLLDHRNIYDLLHRPLVTGVYCMLNVAYRY